MRRQSRLWPSGTDSPEPPDGPASSSHARIILRGHRPLALALLMCVVGVVAVSAYLHGLAAHWHLENASADAWLRVLRSAHTARDGGSAEAPAAVVVHVHSVQALAWDPCTQTVTRTPLLGAAARADAVPSSVARSRAPAGAVPPCAARPAARQQQQHQQEATVAAAAPGAPGSRRATIPRIIHQNYLAGRAALAEAALQPRSHFRKEWWASCQTHHPEWEYVLWDAQMCEALLRRRYPWFLPVWATMSSVVLKSDAMRPFILLEHGGVYLDLDTECLRPMDSSLERADVVLMAEREDLINNAQMASVPGHPVWMEMARRMANAAAQGVTYPLDATGPNLLTRVARDHFNITGRALPGTYTRGASTLRVQGPRSWFTPCDWNDWGCQVELARSLGHGLGDRPVVGAHHFSGSWLGLDGSKSLSLRREGQQGVAEHFANASRFVDARCRKPRLLGLPTPAPRSLSYQVCWEAIQSDLEGGQCTVLSIREAPAAAPHPAPAVPDASDDGSNSQQDGDALFAFEAQLAAAGCRVMVVTDGDGPSDAARAQGEGRLEVRKGVLRAADDPFGGVPGATLPSLMAQLGLERPTVLQVQCGACVWPALAQLYVHDNRLLARVALLLLDLPWVEEQHRHEAYTVHQHLYHEAGLRGYYHAGWGADHKIGGGAGCGRAAANGSRSEGGGCGGVRVETHHQLALLNPRYAGGR